MSDEPTSFERIPDWFHRDGRMRDIVVPGVVPADWHQLLPALAAFGYPLHWRVDGQPVPAMAPAQVFAERERHVVALALLVGRVQVDCVSVGGDEFYFASDDVQVPADVLSLLEFMTRVGDLLGKDVHLTPENTPQAPYATYLASERRFRYAGEGAGG